MVNLTSQPDKAVPSNIDDQLLTAIKWHQAQGDLVLCLSAGGGDSLDEWLRQQFE